MRTKTTGEQTGDIESSDESSGRPIRVFDVIEFMNDNSLWKSVVIQTTPSIGACPIIPDTNPPRLGFQGSIDESRIVGVVDRWEPERVVVGLVQLLGENFRETAAKLIEEIATQQPDIVLGSTEPEAT